MYGLGVSMGGKSCVWVRSEHGRSCKSSTT